MNKIDNSGTGIATLGRDEDSYMAHVAAGEMVVPPVISPETRARLFQEMQQVGLDPNEYTVGEGMSINPITGMPEFGFLRKVFKSVKKVARKAAPVLQFVPGPIGTVAGVLNKAMTVADVARGKANPLQLLTMGKSTGGLDSLRGNVGNIFRNVGEYILPGQDKVGLLGNLSKSVGNFFGGPLNTGGINPGANASGIPNILNTIFGGQTQGGGMQTQGGGFFGGGGLSTLANLIVLRNLLKRPSPKDPSELIPTGTAAFGYTPEMIAALDNQNYRIGNLQPALIQGQQYANIDPESMPKSTPITTAEAGGIMGLEAGGKINPNRMDDDGPGDITPAFLEPGEFVMTRPATRVLGARNLYKLMKEAEQMA